MSIDKRTLRSIFLGIAGCIILSWLLHETERVTTVLKFFRNMLAPFAAGVIIAFILNVPMRAIERGLGWIQKKPVRRGVSLTLTILFLLLCLALVIILVVPQVVETAVSLYNQINALLQKHPAILQWLRQSTGDGEMNWFTIVEQAMNFMGGGVPSLVNGAFSAIGSVYSALLDTVVALVFAIYCLARKEILSRQLKRVLYAFLPEKFCDSFTHILKLTNVTFSNFISGQCIEACILGTLFFRNILNFF